MALFIEFYEVATAGGYEYYYMPINDDATNKENLDSRSHRIWKFNTRNDKIIEILNRRKDKPQINRAEFLKIQLLANPVPYSDYYLRLEEAKKWREQHERDQAQKSSTVD